MLFQSRQMPTIAQKPGQPGLVCGRLGDLKPGNPLLGLSAGDR